MVQDKMGNMLRYLPLSKVKLVKEFLQKVSSDMKEGKYEIDGDNVYARVMSYSTKLPEECEVEAHDIYCDIQFSLVGSEGISIYIKEQLKHKTSDEKKDFFTFQLQGEQEYIKVHNLPGYFTMIFPCEAHRPQESYNRKCEVVKKCVIKIKEHCFYE